jgi:hypothetical protein
VKPPKITVKSVRVRIPATKEVAADKAVKLKRLDGAGKEIIGNAKDLVGVWKRQTFPPASYTFSEDGTMRITSAYRSGIAAEGNWKVVGNEITIKLGDATVREYSFESSNTFSGKNDGLSRETFTKVE